MRYWPTGNPNNYQINLMASQCFGFSRYCQWKVYGVHDGNSPGSFKDLSGYLSTSSCTESTLKSKLLGCAPATHIRLGTNSNGHSITVISTSNSGLEIVECNYDGYCRIRTKSYTWAGFASEVQTHCTKYGYNGIGYINAWKNGPTPSVNLSFDSETASSITSTNATISTWVSNTGKISQIGYYVGTSDSFMTKVVMNTATVEWTRFQLTYNLNDVYGKLSPGQKYYYSFYVIKDGNEYRSANKTFTISQHL